MRRLVLAGNRLQADAFPPAVGKLRALQVLDLSDNRLAQVPAPVCSLAALCVLDLSGNRISALPPRLGDLQSLMVRGMPCRYSLQRCCVTASDLTGCLTQVLGLHGNPLPRKVFDAMNRGLSTLLLELRARAAEEEAAS